MSDVHLQYSHFKKNNLHYYYYSLIKMIMFVTVAVSLAFLNK